MRRRTRIQKDIGDILSSCLDISGIYNMFTCVGEASDVSGIVLIVGSPGTPYHGGYYFFKFEIPDKYPYVAPRITLLTQNGLIRFHPAFFANGHVQLRNLKNWSAGCTLLTLITELYECLGDVVDSAAHTTDALFTKNCWFAVCKMLRAPPAGCEIFMPMMKKHYKETQPALLDKAQDTRIVQLLTAMNVD